MYSSDEVIACHERPPRARSHASSPLPGGMVAGRTYGLAEGALEDFDPRIEFLSRVSTERRDNIDRGILSVVRPSVEFLYRI